MIDPARLRVGLPAVLLDGVTAVSALFVAYRLRFEPGDAAHFVTAGAAGLILITLAQLAAGVVTGLYRRGGQPMWPVRLAAAAVGGMLIGGLSAFALNLGEGLSRQALAIQVALFGLGAALWRSAVGLEVRKKQREALKSRFGHDDMVELGADLASMAGGVARTWNYRHLIFNVVTKDLKLKYQRSVLGFAWSMLNPLIMIGVYAVAFRYVLRIQTPRMVLFILIGLLAWNFFAGAVGSATDAISGNASLLKSVVFPRLTLPFTTVLFNLVQYLLTLLVFLPVMLIVYGVEPHPRMLLFPVFLFLQVVFVTGLSLLLATAATMYRDVKHLIEVGIGIFFWATPIIYEPTMIPESFQQLALLSPTASYIRAYQDIFYYNVVPDFSIWLVAVVYAAGTFVCGLSVFLAYEDSFSEYL
ncbi:MAG TPA: ABC transporter permease [Vicinamibacterales bacterium]|nr:ABC transporter permease [Vicinamibacterales bacterium]